MTGILGILRMIVGALVILGSIIAAFFVFAFSADIPQGLISMTVVCFVGTSLGALIMVDRKAKAIARERKKARDARVESLIDQGVVANKPEYEVVLRGNSFNWPSVCCVCLAPAQESETISITRYLRVFYLEVPYCKECHSDLRPWPFGRGAVGVEFSGAVIDLKLKFKNRVYFDTFLQCNPASVRAV